MEAEGGGVSEERPKHTRASAFTVDEIHRAHRASMVVEYPFTLDLRRVDGVFIVLWSGSEPPAQPRIKPGPASRDEETCRFYALLHVLRGRWVGGRQVCDNILYHGCGRVSSLSVTGSNT